MQPPEEWNRHSEVRNFRTKSKIQTDLQKERRKTACFHIAEALFSAIIKFRNRLHEPRINREIISMTPFYLNILLLPLNHARNFWKFQFSSICLLCKCPHSISWMKICFFIKISWYKNKQWHIERIIGKYIRQDVNMSTCMIINYHNNSYCL